MRFDFYENSFKVKKKEQRAMNKRGLEVVNGILGEAFGKLYVENISSRSKKEEMVTMVDYL